MCTRAAAVPQKRRWFEVDSRPDAAAYEPPITLPFEVKNPWFSGRADIPTFTREEILAIKLRALLQRDKGRDMIDLSHAKAVFANLAAPKVGAGLGKFLKA